jgi:hypothetical protein
MTRIENGSDQYCLSIYLSFHDRDVDANFQWKTNSQLTCSDSIEQTCVYHSIDDSLDKCMFRLNCLVTNFIDRWSYLTHKVFFAKKRINVKIMNKNSNRSASKSNEDDKRMSYFDIFIVNSCSFNDSIAGHGRNEFNQCN